MSGHPTAVSAKPATLVRVLSSRFLHVKYISAFVINTGQGGRETVSHPRTARERLSAVHLPQSKHLPSYSQNTENVQITISTYNINSQGHNFLPS